MIRLACILSTLLLVLPTSLSSVEASSSPPRRIVDRRPSASSNSTSTPRRRRLVLSRNQTASLESKPATKGPAESTDAPIDSHNSTRAWKKILDPRRLAMPRKDAANTTTASSEEHSVTTATNETAPAPMSESSSNTTTPDVTTTNSTHSNATTVAPQHQPSPMTTSPMKPFLMVRPSYMGFPYPQQQPQRGPPGFPQKPTSLVVTEIVASVLANALRLTLLWMATRQPEETMPPQQHFVWESLNDRYARDETTMARILQAPPPGVPRWIWKRRQRRYLGRYRPPRRDWSTTYTKTVVQIELDTKDASFLADVISFLLQQHQRHAFGTLRTTGEPCPLEVVLCVSSPGGAVSLYGLLASQVQRLRPYAKVVVCVDQVAASGGYMIASQADQILAAPFATLGSIGVMMDMLNFHDLAQRHGVTPVTLKAGEHKNALSTFAPVKKKDVRHQEERLAKVHEAFREMIVQMRPHVNLGHVATGDVFLGTEALELGLVDELKTSDEYLQERVRAGDRVLALHKSQQRRFGKKRPNVTPLDLLPHLKVWVKERMSVVPGWVQGSAKMLQTGGAMLLLELLMQHLRHQD